MPLDNINYGLGQDSMQDVFDKTNLTIDEVNAINNWTIEGSPSNIFTSSSFANATGSCTLQTIAYKNKKLVTLQIVADFIFTADTGGGDFQASFTFQTGFEPLNTWDLTTSLITTDGAGGDIRFEEIKYTISPTTLQFDTIGTNSGGPYNRKATFFANITYTI